MQAGGTGAAGWGHVMATRRHAMDFPRCMADACRRTPDAGLAFWIDLAGTPTAALPGERAAIVLTHLCVVASEHRRRRTGGGRGGSHKGEAQSAVDDLHGEGGVRKQELMSRRRHGSSICEKNLSCPKRIFGKKTNNPRCNNSQARYAALRGLSAVTDVSRPPGRNSKI